MGGDDHLLLSKAPHALDVANRLLRQLSFPAAFALIMHLLTKRARHRSPVSVLLHLLSKMKRTSHHLEQSSPPLPWYGLVSHPFPYFSILLGGESPNSMYVLLASPFSSDLDAQSISCPMPARLCNSLSLMPLFLPSMTASSVGCGPCNRI